MKNTIRFSTSWIRKLNNLTDIFAISLIIFAFVVIICLLTRKSRFRNIFNSFKCLHSWNFSDLFTKPTYCNLCESVIVSGFCCDCCNIHVDEKCLKNAEKVYKCKQLFEIKSNNQINNENDMKKINEIKHYWIKGNLPLHSICYKCASDCGNIPELNDYKCVWCWRTVHESCLNENKTTNNNNIIDDDECDFGENKNFILQPNYIYHVNKRFEAIIHSNINLYDTQINEVVCKTNLLWTPLIVFANPKSGSSDADMIIKHFKTVLNPIQIVNMSVIDPEKVFKWIAQHSYMVQFKILVCGGDGSVGWLLEIASKYKFEKQPEFAILPLGTGNDLSRCLRWGEGYDADVEVTDILKQIKIAQPIKLDRWITKFTKLNKNEAVNKQKIIKTKYMNNYLSIGCDALVTLNFHLKRSSLPFSNRFFNKLIYFQYGTIDTFLKECRFLTENIELELDGNVVKLPPLESVVILNIPFWGAGCKVWGEGPNIPEQKINDGLLEVFGIYSSFHIAQLQVGLTEPYRIGQAKNVKIKLLKRFPCQVDGEPWEQNPCKIEISLHEQAIMLDNI